jgi:hypothetical protein
MKRRSLVRILFPPLVWTCQIREGPERFHLQEGWKKVHHRYLNNNNKNFVSVYGIEKELIYFSFKKKKFQVTFTLKWFW